MHVSISQNQVSVSFRKSFKGGGGGGGGGGIVAWRGKGGGMNSFAYIIFLGYHSRGGSKDSRQMPPPERNPAGHVVHTNNL